MIEHVALEGVRLAVRRSGGDGPAERLALLVHGRGHTGAIWAPVAAEIAADCLVLSVDRRGYGASEQGQPAGVQGEADDWAALLMHESARRDPDDDGTARGPQADLVAEGDAIEAALALVSCRPDLVRRLVLVDGSRPGGAARRRPVRASGPNIPAWSAAPGGLALHRALIVCAAPGGAALGQRLMRALHPGMADPAGLRMVTLPRVCGAPLDVAPATVAAIVAGFLRER